MVFTYWLANDAYNIMSHIAKLEHYHKAIRRQELDHIFQEKRIKLLEQDTLQEERKEEGKEERKECRMDCESINFMRMAKICQSEQGIEHVFNLNIQSKLYKYFTSEYLHTQQQDLVSSIFCNLYVISRPQPPSAEFTQDLMFLLEKGSYRAVSNCITMVFNISHDHASWKEALVRQYKVCSLLCRQLQRQGITHDQTVNVLRTMVILVKKSSPHDSFRLFFPLIINILGNVLNNSNWIISHAYFCFYHLSLMYNQEACSLINQHQLLPHLMRLSPLLVETKFAVITLRIIEYSVLYIEEELLRKKVVPFVENIMRNGYKGGDKNLRIVIYTLIQKLLIEAKITSRQLMSEPIGVILMENFAEEEDSEVLSELVQLFSIVIMNLELSPLTEQLERLFERVERILPFEIETIGYIKQTQRKAKIRAMMMF